LHFHLFLFLLLPPPPTSTLFPYTTLFRSLCGPNELGGHRPIENPHSLLNGSGNRSTFHGRGVAGPEEVVLSSETCTDSRRLRCCLPGGGGACLGRRPRPADRCGRGRTQASRSGGGQG